MHSISCIRTNIVLLFNNTKSSPTNYKNIPSSNLLHINSARPPRAKAILLPTVPLIITVAHILAKCAGTSKNTHSHHTSIPWTGAYHNGLKTQLSMTLTWSELQHLFNFFSHSGELTVTTILGYHSSHNLSWGDILVDSNFNPFIVLKCS